MLSPSYSCPLTECVKVELFPSVKLSITLLKLNRSPESPWISVIIYLSGPIAVKIPQPKRAKEWCWTSQKPQNNATQHIYPCRSWPSFATILEPSVEELSPSFIAAASNCPISTPAQKCIAPGKVHRCHMSLFLACRKEQNGKRHPK